MLRPSAPVASFGFAGDDEALVVALRRGDRAAKSALVARYGRYVEQILVRVLGFDEELPDLFHEVFLVALDSIDELRDPSALRLWLRGITIFTVRSFLRRRRRWRWFAVPGEQSVPDVPATAVSPEAREALVRTYRVLQKLRPDERIAFALRFIAEMELTEVAAACEVSLSTIKRRLGRAEKRFVLEAAKDPLIRDWLERGERWSTP
jgi:RNA polymerase sigma-70 factor (ECF subfamily)